MRRYLASFFVWVALPCATALGQPQPCEPGWVSLAGSPGTNGPIFAATLWDPDGTGPLTPRVVVAGAFSTVGGGGSPAVSAANIAAWDPVTDQWSALGSGITGGSGIVWALLALPNGQLIAGGSFNNAGGTSAVNIAMWTPAAGSGGGSWSGLGTGTSHAVRALTVWNGDVIAGGDFIIAGGVGAQHVARWNAAASGGLGAWSSLGAGFNGSVFAFTVLPGGELLAGGAFSFSAGVSMNSVARWNPSTGLWTALGAGLNGIVYAFATLPDGTLIAGGDFARSGTTFMTYIARWNTASSAWSGIGSGMNNIVFSFALTRSGELVAGGSFTTASGASATRIARRAGDSWATFGVGPDSNVNALVLIPDSIGGPAAGQLFAAGQFHVAGAQAANGVARYSFGSLCPADFNCSRTIEAQDLFAYLNAWFALDPRTDFNLQGGLTTQDIFDYLNAWFLGC